MTFAKTLVRSAPLALAFVAVARDAPAQKPEGSKEMCGDAYADSQLRRRNNELLLARQKLRFCASDTCPAFMRTDCVEWLGQVERAIPSVVLEAKDEQGFILDATVTMDGKTIATKLDGKS